MNSCSRAQIFRWRDHDMQGQETWLKTFYQTFPKFGSREHGFSGAMSLSVIPLSTIFIFRSLAMSAMILLLSCDIRWSYISRNTSCEQFVIMSMIDVSEIVVIQLRLSSLRLWACLDRAHADLSVRCLHAHRFNDSRWGSFWKRNN